MHADEGRLNELSRTVIGCAFTVINTLGAGFLEKVHENALAHELRKAGCGVGLLVELKTVPALNTAHRGQCDNYLKATGLPLCLLLNCGTPRLEIKRAANHL